MYNSIRQLKALRGIKLQFTNSYTFKAPKGKWKGWFYTKIWNYLKESGHLYEYRAEEKVVSYTNFQDGKIQTLLWQAISNMRLVGFEPECVIMGNDIFTELTDNQEAFAVLTFNNTGRYIENGIKKVYDVPIKVIPSLAGWAIIPRT